jgi:hypothetical protein
LNSFNASPPPEEGISLVTWNVWFDSLGKKERAEAIVEEIETLQPRVVCLQEVVKTLTLNPNPNPNP